MAPTFNKQLGSITPLNRSYVVIIVLTKVVPVRFPTHYNNNDDNNNNDKEEETDDNDNKEEEEDNGNEGEDNDDEEDDKRVWDTCVCWSDGPHIQQAIRLNHHSHTPQWIVVIRVLTQVVPVRFPRH